MPSILPVQTIVCGLSDLDARLGDGASHVLSILDPGFAIPSALAGGEQPGRTMLFFDDAIAPAPNVVLPSAEDVAAIRGFARVVADSAEPSLVVHCHYGTSRSPAALAIILAELDPDLAEDDVFAEVLAIRPRSWPNSRMIALADEAMGRGGRFTSALRRLYGRQLPAYPELRELMIRLNRAAEIEAAIPPN